MHGPTQHFETTSSGGKGARKRSCETALSLSFPPDPASFGSEFKEKGTPGSSLNNLALIRLDVWYSSPSLRECDANTRADELLEHYIIHQWRLTATGVGSAYYEHAEGPRWVSESNALKRNGEKKEAFAHTNDAPAAGFGRLQCNLKRGLQGR